MYQDPTPGIPHVVDGLRQIVDVVPELPEPAITVEAQDATDVAGLVVMVHMLRILRPTDRAHSTLLSQQLLELLLSNPVPPPQVVFTRTAVVLLFVLSALDVVARLAVTTVAATTSSITRKVCQRLDGLAVRAVPVAFRHLAWLPDLSAVLGHNSLGIARRSVVASLTASRIGYFLLFPPFLDVASNKLFCVFLENRVDFVQKVVDFLGNLLDSLGDLGVYRWRRGLVDLGVTAGLARL
jgi:hypothetical protein